MGTKITLHVMGPEDMTRDVLKVTLFPSVLTFALFVNSCSWSLPEINEVLSFCSQKRA